ncbi:diguanylate cyclase domain-containing protein [Rhodanobacter lindaniclasticus]
MPNRAAVPGELRERFYRSVAETLSLLHAAPGHDRRRALLEVSRILAATMELPLVWIGRRESGVHAVEVVAAAGPAQAYATALQLSDSPDEPGGRGPVGIALREERARVTPVGSTEFAFWREAAREHGFGACIVAASRTRDGGQLVLASYSREGGPALGTELLDWAQRLVDELSRFWDHQILLERSIRMSRYRDAQRTIQRALLEQPDPEAIYPTLARALADIAGAAAVDVFAVEPGQDVLRRVALVGPMADVMRELPMPPRQQSGPIILAPTLAYMQGAPVIRRKPAGDAAPGNPWRPELSEHAGAVGCWPLFAEPRDGADPAARTPAGVFVVVTVEADAFDEEMCRLLDEIADAAGLALRQHAQRHALRQEQERQAWLASHDDLTDLPNRRALDRHLDAVLAGARRQDRRVAVGLLDLDDLKPINDRHGHAVGDRILIEIAERLRRLLRGDDYVARFGGDEFVLVFDDLQHEGDLDDLLERIGASLLQPVSIDGKVLPIGASLGIAMYSSDGHASGEQLLRLADQAMYQVKARKRHRARWWMVARPGGALAAAEPDGQVAPYGEGATALLLACRDGWQSRLPAVVESFCGALLEHEGVGTLLRALPEGEYQVLKSHMYAHLQVLTRADLDLASHRKRAMRTGLFHAACGVEEVWLLEAVEQLREDLLAVLAPPDRRALDVVLQRLGTERQWQLESMRAMQRQRVALLARLNALAWSAEGYLGLIQGVVDILASHKEFSACAVGRPDDSGRLTYEAVAGNAFAAYLRALAAGEALPIRVDADHPEGGGSSGRAWRTVSIQRCVHFGSDPTMVSWRDMAMGLGVISSVSIPLCPLRAEPVVLLSLYSPYAGGMQSEDQRAFVEQVKSVLDLALARLSPPRQGAELLPFFVRECWRARIATDALQMHYQPLIRLADGEVTEFEALARLRDVDGTLLAPGRFLPALDADDLVVLFRQGLALTTACRESLRRAGHPLDMSVNVPAAALEDSRYAAAAAAVLADSGCPPGALLLEILESPLGGEHPGALDEPGMQSLKALGVRLVEDDLGAGYSSLIRLRQWPFDRIKIDQAIVLQARHDPLNTLRFIRQLIRIGNDLRLEVVVEGLETPDLIEAASLLGADFGQGYALARPMPVEALASWMRAHRPAPRARVPCTSLGALAGELLWEEQFVALPAEPAFWAAHAERRCGPGEYLHAIGLDDSLGASHQAMHEAALKGPQDPEYRHARAAFLAKLVEHVLGAAAT